MESDEGQNEDSFRLPDKPILAEIKKYNKFWPAAVFVNYSNIIDFKTFVLNLHSWYLGFKNNFSRALK